MFSVILKLIHCPVIPDMVPPEYPELQARLQKKDKPVMILLPARGPAGY
jgi:hypothetical protein